MLTQRHKEQLDGLVKETILPALFEDLGINDEKTEKEAINYLIEKLKE